MEIVFRSAVGCAAGERARRKAVRTIKAAIYCRLSKEDEEQEKEAPGKESESIQNQKSMLVNYAIEKGYDIYRIYSDEDYSGIDRDRPDFNRMLEAANQHKFDIILAKTQSRFTRDMELVEKYLHGKFVEWGIRFTKKPNIQILLSQQPMLNG